ncbi:MAG: MerR family DNA-binding transcriptional regulator, partial [Candidatus Levyibacteriota bacterium]
MTKNLPHQDYLTIGRAAKLLGVSIDTLRRWEAAGRITSERLDGKNRFFKKDAVLELRNNKPLTILEAAKALSVSKSTLRRLEEKGVIVADRDENGNRVYSQQAVKEFLSARKKKKIPGFDLYASSYFPANTTISFPKPVIDLTQQPAPVTASETVASFEKTDAPVSTSPIAGISPVAQEEEKRPFIQRGLHKGFISGTVEKFIASVPVTHMPHKEVHHISNYTHNISKNINIPAIPDLRKAVVSLGVIVLLCLGLFSFTVMKDLSGTSPESAALLGKLTADQKHLAALTDAQKKKIGESVLAESTGSGVFTVNLRSVFNQDVRINNKNLDLGTGQITASNIIYSVTPGAGISVSGGQTPTIANTGVLSLGGTAGTIELGSGLTISGNTLSSTAVAQSAFSTIKAGGSSFSAGSGTDTLEFVAGSGIGLSTDTGSKKITITSSVAAANPWTLDNNNLYPNSTSDLVGIGNTAPTATLDVTGTFNLSGAATFGSSINVTGPATFASTTSFGGVSYTWPGIDGSPGFVLTTDGAGGLSWSSSGGVGTNYFAITSGAVHPIVSTLDFLVGGTSTASSKFAVLNMASGTPSVSINGGSGNLVLTANGSLTTTGSQNMTIGSATAGNITLSPANGSGTVTSLGTVTLASGKTYQINNTDVLTATTLGSGVTASSLTTIGALVSGSIANGFGTINSGSTITGTTINGTTGINTGAGAGTQRIDVSGNLSNIGNISSSYLSASAGVVNLSAATIFQSNGVTILDASRNIANIGTTEFNTVTYTWPGADAAGSNYVLTSSGTGLLSWIDPGNIPSVNFFGINAGAVYPRNYTLDFLLGSDSTASSRFAVMNVSSGVPTATLSAGGAGGMFITANGTLASTSYQNITVGGGSSGNITLSPMGGAGTVTSTGSITLSSGKTYQINGTDVLSSSTLGTGVTSSSLTTTGALVSGSIANGFGTINSGNTITGTTINGTTGINTGAGAGTQRIDSSGNLTGIGTTQFNSVTYTWPGTAGTNGYALVTDGSGTLSWQSTTAFGTNDFTIQSGAIYPTNTTLDFLVGGSATDAARFAFMNVDSGVPTASLSAGTNGGIFLTANGTLESTASQNITIGGGNSGNITLNPFGGVGTVTSTGSITLSSGKTYQINGIDVLSSSTLGTGVTSSSLTTTGALVSGSIASGFGTIATANTITGTTLNGTTGINTGAGAGTQRIDASGNLANIGNISSTYLSTGVNTVNIAAGTALQANGTTVLDSSRNIQNIGTTQFNSIIYTWPGSQSANYVLQTNGSGTLTWVNPGSLPTSNYFSLNAGTIYPSNTTLDLLIGANSSASAKFGFLNINSGNPAIQISGADVLTATTLGTGVTSSSLTTTGALVSGSIASGFGTIATANTITGTTLNGTTGINTGAGAGTQRIDASGNLSNIGTTQFNSLTYTWPGSQTAGYFLQTNGSGTLSWQQAQTGTEYWTAASGLLYPVNSTLDFALGATATTSSKFAVLNVGNGVPVASLSAGGNGGAYLTANGNLATTAYQNLTLGGGTTGDIVINPRGGSGFLTFNGDRFSDITGDGLAVNSNALSVDLLSSSASAGLSSSRSGLEFNVGAGSKNQLGLLQGCTNGQLLKWDSVNGEWTCGDDIGGVSSAVIKIQEGTNSPITGIDTLRFTAPDFDVSNTGATGVISLDASISRFLSLNGAAYLYNTTQDLLIGGNASASAKFGFLNVNSGNPAIQISGADVLTATTLGTGVTSSSLTTTGALVSGSIASGFGTIATANTITGTTLNGTTGINTGAGAGTQRIDASGNLTNIGTTQFNSLTYTWPGSQGVNYILQTNGSGTLSWIDPAGLGTNYFSLNAGAIYPTNTTLDFLVGSSATVSSKFAVLNVGNGVPVASLSAGTAGGAYLTANGTLATTANQ